MSDIDHAAEARKMLSFSPRDVVRFDAKWSLSGGCWQWLAAIDAHGYGRFSVGGRMKLAHRIAYEMFVAPIPRGLDLDHICRNRACVNPAHLEPVTRSENLSRSPLMGVKNIGKTHCPRGHEYSAENTRFNTSGARNCRECERSRNRNRKRAGIYNAHVSCEACGKVIRKNNMNRHMNAFHKPVDQARKGLRL